MIARRRIPLARKNLAHDPRRLLIAICGIGFAAVLMFIETGFENALFDSTVSLVQNLKADLIVASKGQYALLSAETFSRRRIRQARGCRGVEGVYPVYVELYRGTWKPPGRKRRPIRVLACEVGDPVFDVPAVAECAESLQRPRTALIDSQSKAKHAVPGSLEEVLGLRGGELCGRTVRLVGTFEMGTDFINDGNLIIDTANFAACFPDRAAGKDPLSVVDVGVVQLVKGADVRDVKRRLQQILPDDVEVFTKQEYIEHEVSFWAESSPIGFIFFMGTMIGFVVGVIICYQIIYADVADHMAEFATLKAMGYRNRYFIILVLQESCYLSMISFVPALLVSFAIYHGLAQYTGLLMILSFKRAAFVLLLTTAMCIVSGCLAVHKVLAADPAELF